MADRFRSDDGEAIAVPVQSILRPGATSLLGDILVDIIPLANGTVTLCLYTFWQSETFLGYAVRYLRAPTTAYTRADVMLVPWNPLH